MGTASNENFVAAAVSASTGTANTTINSGDSVDGGAGNDTLTITATATNNNSLTGLTVKNVETIKVVGSDNFAVTAAGSPTVATGAKQVLDFVVSAGAASGTPTVSVVINGVTHTATYNGNSTAATALSNKATAIKGIIDRVIGGTATTAVSGSEITVTSNSVGTPLPSITATANDGASSAVVAALSIDDSTGATQKAAANVVRTNATAVSQVITATLNDGDTANFASGQTVTIFVDGVSRGSISLATASEATAAANIVTELNKVLGTGVASSTGSQITITAPVAGTPLPQIALTLSSIDTDQTSSAAGTGENIVFAVARENVAVGAATTTTTTAATVNAAQFVGATSIAVDGNATTITGLTTQSVELSGATMANSLRYSAGATAATIALNKAAGTVTLTDVASPGLPVNTLTTVNVTGTVKDGTAATARVLATNGALTIDETTNSAADTVKTLNVAISGTGADLTISGLSKLATFDASGSTGNIKVTTGAAVNSVKGGAGADNLTIGVVTDVNSTTGLTSASVDAGEGNDTIALSSAVANGTGTVTVNGGAGNDTVDVRLSGITGYTVLNGGDGTDTLRFAGATSVSSNAQSLTNAEYAMINSMATGFETFRTAAGTGTTSTATDTINIDASKLSGFTTLRFDSAAAVTKVADAQAVTGVQNITATATNYIAAGTAAAAAAGLTSTQYGGALTVNASGSSKTTTVNADSATVNVSNIPDSSTIGSNAAASSSITITGDVKTLTVNLTSTTDYVRNPSNDVISTATITPADTGFATAYSALGNLTSVVLKGVGSVVLDNSDKNDTNNPINPTTANTRAGSKLTVIDASGLGGTYGSYDVTNVGKPLGGLTYTGNVFLSETVTLGAGKDSLTFNSTYDKMDTINGLKLVATPTMTLDLDLSDDLAQVSGVVKVTTGLTATTLDGVLAQVAALGGASTTYDKVVFQFGGNTYFFAESSSQNTALSNDDTVVKFTGLIDLDLLVAAFVA